MFNDFSLRDALFVAGIAAIAYGGYMIWPPLAWIAGGAVAVAAALLASWRNAKHGPTR